MCNCARSTCVRAWHGLQSGWFSLNTVSQKLSKHSHFYTSFFSCSAVTLFLTLLTIKRTPALNFTVFSMPHKHHGTYVIAIVGVGVEDLRSTENYKILQGIFNFFRNCVCSIKKSSLFVWLWSRKRKKLMVMLKLVSQISLGRAFFAET